MRLNGPTPPLGAGFVVAVSMTVTVFALQYQLRSTLGDIVVFSPFLLATVVAAWYGGLWPGLAATLLSTGLATYFFVEPLYSFGIASQGDLIGILLILIIGAATSLVSDSLHRARAQLVAEQKRLRISEEFHQAIAELTSDFAFSYRIGTDRRQVVEAVSEGFTKLFGYTAEEVTAAGGPGPVLFGPDLSRHDLSLQQLAAGRSVEEEFRYVGRDGRVRWLHFHTKPVADPVTGQLRLISAGSDISRRRAAESAHRVTEERFRVMAETVPSMIWTADADGTITYANEQWLRFGSGASGIDGSGLPSLAMHPDDRARCLALWTRAVREGTDYEAEVRHQRHDGEWRWFMTRARPLRDADGVIVCWFGVTTDIHQQKELEARLRQADRQKDDFLATLAHELRNPLAPISSALEVLELSDDDRTQRAAARGIMHRQLRQLVRLVDDLLDVNRITRGKLEIRRETVELAAVVRDAVETSRPIIDAHAHVLMLELAAEPIFVDGDRTRLAQVCANLLNNAAKFTDRGGRIHLSISREEGEAVIRVRDTGIGIDDTVLPRIFDLFAQGDSSLEGSRGGLGIGLTLVRRLVEAHGGTVGARSAGAGRGSEFEIRLPSSTAAPVRQAEAAVSRVADAPPRRILVVDDNEDAATSLGLMLRLTSHDVRTAHDGEEALALAAADRPDVVLLDIGMPRMSGYRVAELIRKQEWGRSMALIALTGWGQIADRERSRAAGFDHHLTKPVDPQQLARLLAEVRRAPDPPRA
ncbi:MAG TPA: PAS domain S-box protein [Gemmatimonadaceae bacterium]|nr:PAS domain S-box protein [Gemmatimonadaceae bacterium]